jgi:hypothetical protein
MVDVGDNCEISDEFAVHEGYGYSRQTANNAAAIKRLTL